MKSREVQCSGRVKLGPAKGDRCRRTKILPLDRSDNTKLYWCYSHRRSR